MNASIHRIFTIARATITEMIRQRVLLVILLFALLAIASSQVFSQFTLEAKFKSVKDIGMNMILLFGILISIVGIAQMLQSEFDQRTIYTILAKPVRRFEFLIGKYVGMLGILLIAFVFMVALFSIMLFLTERNMLAEELSGPGLDEPHVSPDGAVSNLTKAEFITQEVLSQSRDPRLIQALVLTFVRSALVAALALLVASFATSMIFTASTSFMLVLISHLQGVAREAWLGQGAVENVPARAFLGVLAILLPDLSLFGITDDIIAGNDVAWSFVTSLSLYGSVYVLVYVTVACLIFSGREL
jgi:hypothetical protein